MAEETMPRPGTIALVTGASSGIGATTAAALADIGCRVICAGRRLALLEEIAGGIGDQAHALVLDVADPESVESMAERLPPELRDIDILINNAGSDLGGRTRFDEGTVDDWANTIETNVTGLIRVTYAVIHGMVARDIGHVVNIGSTSGYTPYAGGTIYAGSKHAVHGFSESLRKDFCKTGIRVTEILPGMVETGFALARWGDAERATKFYGDFGDCLAPEDIARMVIFALQQPAQVAISQLTIVPSSQR
jgi:3-hydroxy acid dehydrogenase/malonic semialdehyde reductase